MFNVDINKNLELPTFILQTKNFDKLGDIKDVQEFDPSFKLASAWDFSATVYKTLNGVENPLWDKIVDNKVVYIKEYDTNYDISVNISDADSTKKTIVGTALCEAELSQLLLRNIEINTEVDIAREDYIKPTVFYDEIDASISLLNRILEKAPHYKIGYVSPTLRPIQRSFSVDNTSIYDFMVGDLAKEMDCLFQFDSLTRTINVYDLLNYCNDCKKRFESSEPNPVCPHCESTNVIKGYGKDTNIFVSKDNLAKTISLESNKDKIKNYFRIVGGDDIITSAVRDLTMGSGYVYNITDEVKQDMSAELLSKLSEYETQQTYYEPIFADYAQHVYDATDEILNLQSGMMPKPEIDTTSKAADQLAKILISSVSVKDISKASISTVENAITSMAKIYIDTGRFTFDFVDGDTYVGYNWVGKFKVTNRSDSSDVAISSNNVSIAVNDNYLQFVQEKITKALAKEDIKDQEYDWTLYSLERLKSFESAYQSVISVLTELEIGKETDTYHETIYIPYFNKLSAIHEEMHTREQQIINQETTQDYYNSKMAEVRTLLDKETYFGESYKELCKYLREDTYSNENYVSTGLNNAEIIAKAKELIEIAEKNCKESSQINWELTADINNLLAMDEFSSLKDSFELGNWIHIECNDIVYRLRLSEYRIKYTDDPTIEVTFSDLTKVSSILSDVQSVLDSAKSMGTTVSFVTQQAKKSADSVRVLDNWTQAGLITDCAIANDADNQEVIFDKHGILIRMFDEFENAYDPKQMKLFNRSIVMTTDAFATIKTAFGAFTYVDKDGVKHEAYGINGETIMGKMLIGESLYIENASATFRVDANGVYLASYATKEDLENVTANLVSISSNSPVFKMESGATSYSPSQVLLTPTFQNCNFVKWQYSIDDGTTWVDIVSGQHNLYINSTTRVLTINNDCDLYSSIKNVSFKIVTDVTEAYDIMSIPVLTDGEEGYTIILTNESHVFPCDVNRDVEIATSTTTSILAYKGTTEVTPVIGTLPTVSGLAITKSGTTITISTVAGSSLATEGTFDIPITVDGKSFTKKFSWVKSNATMNNIIASINLSGEIAKIHASKIQLEGAVTVDGTFGVNDDGKIYITGGTLAGMTITGKHIYANNVDGNNNPIGFGLCSDMSNAGIALYTGVNETNMANAPFRVYHSGEMWATKGHIGGCEVKGGGLFANDMVNSKGFGLCSTDVNDNIAFYAGATELNMAGAPTRIYHDGKAVLNDLYTNNIHITGGTININTASSTENFINLTYNENTCSMRTGGLITYNSATKYSSDLESNGLFLYDGGLGQDTSYYSFSCVVYGHFEQIGTETNMFKGDIQCNGGIWINGVGEGNTLYIQTGENSWYTLRNYILGVTSGTI